MKRTTRTVLSIPCALAALSVASAAWAEICPPPESVRIGHKGDFVFPTDFDANGESKVTSWTGAELKEDSKAQFLSHLVCHYSTGSGAKVNLQSLAGAQIEKRIADLPAWKSEKQDDGSTVYRCTKSLLDCNWF